MKKLLVIESSPRIQDSYSRKVTLEVIKQLQAKHGELQSKTRDLAKSTLPHVTEALIGSYYTAPEQRSPSQKDIVQLSDSLVDEVLEADFIVIGSPMWNFNVPSVLKAWIDHIVRAGRTFAFGPDGLKGLVQNKKVYLVLASGSVFSDGPFKSYDFQEPYLRAVLGFIGMTDVTAIKVEGLNDPKSAPAAVDKALSIVARI